MIKTHKFQLTYDRLHYFVHTETNALILHTYANDDNTDRYQITITITYLAIFILCLLCVKPQSSDFNIPSYENIHPHKRQYKSPPTIAYKVFIENFSIVLKVCHILQGYILLCQRLSLIYISSIILQSMYHNEFFGFIDT